MKNYIILFALLLSSGFCKAQDDPYAEKVESIDAIIENLYAVISGEKNEKRDWDLFRYLFTPEAKLIPTGANRQGVNGYRYMSPDEYVESSGKWLEENGFFETEISRELEVYGNIAHVFSTYESRYSASDEQPFARGINSIQLYNDGNRWWVMNIFWQGETAAMPIPNQYLPGKG